jgi:ketopantoate reductase
MLLKLLGLVEKIKTCGAVVGITSVIGQLKIIAGKAEDAERKAYNAVIDKLMKARKNMLEAKSDEKANWFKKLVCNICIGFIAAAQLFIGTVKFTFDVIGITARMFGRIVCDVFEEVKVAGVETKNAFEEDILSVFKK